jgi:hypothetical protein
MVSRSAMRSDRIKMRARTKGSPANCAAEHLRRIARLTGAKQIAGGGYSLRAGHQDFLVDSKFVRLISHRCKSTCFSVGTVPDIPSAEIVATVLLQLKNNPKLFKKWKKQPGYMFKANGKKFGEVGPIIWPEAFR